MRKIVLKDYESNQESTKSGGKCDNDRLVDQLLCPSWALRLAEKVNRHRLDEGSNFYIFYRYVLYILATFSLVG